MSCSRVSVLGLCGSALLGTLLVLDARGRSAPEALDGSLRGGRRLQAEQAVGTQLVDAAQEHGSHLADKAWEHGGHLADKAWEHGGNLADKAYEHGSAAAGKAYEHGSALANSAWERRHEALAHGKNAANHVYEHGSKWAGKAYEHGSNLANDAWENRHEIAGRAYEHGSNIADAAYRHGSYVGGKAWEHGSRLGHHIRENPGLYGHHLANNGWIFQNGALWPLAFLDGFPAAWKAAIVVAQAIFAIIYYVVVVSNYPFWMGPSPVSAQLQREQPPLATLQTSPANCCLSFLCPQARAAHTFDRTGTIEYFCGLLAMFLCPFCTLCYANACMDLNPKLGGEPANPIMSAVCTWCCSCCVIAQDAESLDAATGARTELCGVTEGMNPMLGPMGGMGPPGMYPQQMMMHPPKPYY